MMTNSIELTTYTSYDLLLIKQTLSNKPQLDDCLFTRLKGLCLLRPARRCRGGRQLKERLSGKVNKQPDKLDHTTTEDSDLRSPPNRVTEDKTSVASDSVAHHLPKLHVCLLNTRSVKNKASQIMDYIIEEALDIMLITETWLRPGTVDQAVIGDMAPPGYSVLHQPRSTGRGGGVAMVMRDTIKVTMEPTSTYETFEYMRVKAITSSLTYRIIIMYRPPPSTKNKLTISSFLEEFDDFLAELILVRGKLIIAGDINFHLDKTDDGDGLKIKTILDSYGLQQLVGEPTHQNNHTLDAVITRTVESPVSDLTVTDPLLSDHKAVTFNLNTQRPPLPKKTIVYRNFKKINVEKLKEDISNNVHLNGEFLQDTKPTGLWQEFSDAAMSLIDQHAPEKTKLITIRPKVDWYTDLVEQARREKRKCERKWRKTGLTIHRQLFSDAKDALTKTITTAKKEFISQKISTSGNSQKALFNCVEQLCHHAKSSLLPDIDDSKELGESMDTFFEGKVFNLRDELKNAQDGVDNYFESENLDTRKLRAFPAISAEDLKKIILKAPTKSSPLDPIPTKILKECIDQLLPALVKIINASLASSTVPAPFKKAIVTPLIKKPTLDRNVLKNYRPVSNLQFMSKILEKVVSKFLDTHRVENGLHIPLQSAYRQNHSTETALLKVHNDILTALDRGECVFLILLDLSAAFDTVDHTRLQERLSKRFGVTDAALQWLNSYLTGRTQAVAVRGVESKNRNLIYGVPQGSVLGPELFKDYIAPLADLIQSYGVSFHGYADDTQLYVTFKPSVNENNALDQMQQCIAAIKSWMAMNWLKLNDDKTEFIILGSPCNLDKVTTQHITVGDHKIKKSAQVRNIGAIFDTSVTMQPQVTKTSQTAWYHLYVISKIRTYLTKEQTQCLIHAYVTSRLDQNNSLLMGVPATLLQKLQKIQNAAAKVILGGKRNDHVTPLLVELHWLPLSQRHIFKTLLLVFKALKGFGPSYLAEMLKPYTPERELRSSFGNFLETTKTRCVKYGDRAFSVAGPVLWNNLPTHIRNCQSIESFKNCLKTHLFRTA